MINKNQKPLSEIMMCDGTQTAQEWLITQLEVWREIEIEAIYECLRLGMELHKMNIQSTARRLDAKRNPKGW